MSGGGGGGEQGYLSSDIRNSDNCVEFEPYLLASPSCVATVHLGGSECSSYISFGFFVEVSELSEHVQLLPAIHFWDFS